MAKPKAQVEGVYEKNPGSGIWYTRLRVNGKLVRKKIGTFKAAKEYIEKARTVRNTGAGIVPQTARHPARTLEELERIGGAVTVGALCEDWLKHIKSRPTEYKDQRNPPQRVRQILEAFGQRAAGALKPYEISDWLDSFKTAPATRNKLKFTLSSVYRLGKERDKVQVNPARDVKARKTGKGVVRYLLPDEEERIRAVLLRDVNSCPAKQPVIRKRLLHRIYELDVSLGTGLRKGEQYGLCWPDVDFEQRTITARDTKNGETRVVPMINDVHYALKAIQAMGLGRKDKSSDKPNQSPKDSVFRLEDNKKWWLKTLEAAKVENYRWHDNRHTFCSRLAQSGASLKIIQEAAGHKTIQMSARYAHMHQTHLADAMAVLNRKETASL